MQIQVGWLCKKSKMPLSGGHGWIGITSGAGCSEGSPCRAPCDPAAEERQWWKVHGGQLHDRMVLQPGLCWGVPGERRALCHSRSGWTDRQMQGCGCLLLQSLGRWCLVWVRLSEGSLAFLISWERQLSRSGSGRTESVICNGLVGLSQPLAGKAQQCTLMTKDPSQQNGIVPSYKYTWSAYMIALHAPAPGRNIIDLQAASLERAAGIEAFSRASP